MLFVTALGATVGIDLTELSDDAALAVRHAWADAAITDTHIETPETETQETPVVTPRHPHDTAHLLAELSPQVTLAAIEARRGQLWMLHAAGLALDDGRVVALVGPSGRGKTTASRALGEVFGYVSDETVAVDADGRVWPYRKPLSIVSDHHKLQLPPSELGLRPLPAADLRLAGIVLLDRRADAEATPVIEQVPLADALEDLVTQSSYLSAMPAPLRTIAATVDAVGGVHRVIYREADSLIPVLEQLASPAVTPSRVDGAIAEAPAPRAGTYSRAAVHDVLELDDRLAILQLDDAGAGTLRILAGVAPALWCAADAATFDDLLAATVAAHGSHADAEAIVRAALDEFEANGLLAAPGD